MELIDQLLDLPYCLARLGPVFRPCAIAAVLVAACAMACRVRKSSVVIALVAAFAVVAIAQWERAVTQWRLGWLESEAPEANETAYTLLNRSLSSDKIWQFMQIESEDPNVRFALALMLHERGEDSLLQSKPVAPLQGPGFFGDGHLARAALKLEFPLEVRQLPWRLADFPSPLTQRAVDPLEELREFAEAQRQWTARMGESR